MPCMNVNITRIGGMSVTATKKGGMNARMALVCGTSLGRDVELLWVTDNYHLATTDGEFILVKRVF